MKKVEFKLKQEGLKWEDTPVYLAQTFFDHSDIDYFAKSLSKRFNTEVRWNFKDLTQGHYVNEIRK